MTSGETSGNLDMVDRYFVLISSQMVKPVTRYQPLRPALGRASQPATVVKIGDRYMADS